MATRQEEIRGEIALRIHTQDRGMLQMVDEASPVNTPWDKLAEKWKEYYRKEADRFLSYLHSQGVVIKTDRELPKVETYCKLANVDCIPKLTVRQTMLKAGYVAVEPLVEEVDNV